jgi:hypothetical protein
MIDFKNNDPRKPCGQPVLTFAELEASSCFLATWFFTFNRTRVTFQQTCGFEGRAVIGTYFK